jgi:rhamnosyltransferase
MRNAASESTLAAIVSFNGGENTLKLIDRLRLMVDCVYIVDNGSSMYSKDLLASKGTDLRVKILFLPENYGIGKALNLALEYAYSHNYKWFITFDQDSMPSLNMIKKILEFRHVNRNSRCFTPTLVTSKNSETINSEIANSIVSYAITSGNMIAVDVALEIGGYDEIYFIDCVDFEFSLRLRRYGYEIFRVGDAKMAHRVGDETSVPFFLKKFYLFKSFT